MRSLPLFWRLFPSIFAVAVLVLVVGAATAALSVRDFHLTEVREDLEARAKLVSMAIADRGPAELQPFCRQMGHTIHTRITVVAPDGTVLCDSEHDPSTMDNHASRPEVRQALGGRVGMVRRYSHTLNTEMMYVAVPHEKDGKVAAVVRASVPLRTIEEALGSLRHTLLVGLVLSALAAALLALGVSRRIARPMEELTRAVRDPDGEIPIPAGAPREVRILAAALREMTERMRATERMRRDFVANVSHELKTPITSIRGFAETLLDGVLEEDPEAARRFVATISANAERMERIVQDLLTLASLEREEERNVLEFATVRIAEVVEGAVRACAWSAESRRVGVVVDVPASLTVEGNARLLEQAFINLLDNAIKYGGEGSTVEISAARKAGWVEVSFRDQGPGIPEEEIPRIFERFYRIDKARSRELGGTGLGLAIVKHVAQIHGGEVVVRSEVGRGSTFVVRLPAERGAPEFQRGES